MHFKESVIVRNDSKNSQNNDGRDRCYISGLIWVFGADLLVLLLELYFVLQINYVKYALP